MPLAIIPGSGLPVRHIIQNIAAVAPKAAAMAVLVATTANWTSVAAKVEAALKPNQPNSRMKRAQHGHRDVVARDACWPSRPC